VGQLKHAKMVEAYEKVIAACKKHGVAPGIHLTEADQAKEWLAKGCASLLPERRPHAHGCGKANTLN